MLWAPGANAALERASAGEDAMELSRRVLMMATECPLLLLRHVSQGGAGRIFTAVRDVLGGLDEDRVVHDVLGWDDLGEVARSYAAEVARRTDRKRPKRQRFRGAHDKTRRGKAANQMREARDEAARRTEERCRM